MLDSVKFEFLIDRFERGDVDAARTLVEMYEPSIQRLAQKGLTSARLRRVVDASDISQSVFEHFFMCAKRKTFRAASPETLFAFLKKITRNLIIDEQRKHSCQKRGGQVVTIATCSFLKADEHGPSSLCEIKDLSDFVRSSLSRVERDIADLRARGYSWAEISEKTGKPQDQLRKKLQRAFERIRSQTVVA